MCLPDFPFTTFEPYNSSHDVPELVHKIRRSPNLEALKLCKGQSGRIIPTYYVE